MGEIERAGYLPGLDEGEVGWETLAFDRAEPPVEVQVPVLSEAQIGRLAATVRAGARAGLKSRRADEIVEIVDAVIRRLLDRGDPYRRELDRLLPAITGYDGEMVRLGLSEYLKTFRKPQLTRFLAEDFANPGLLDSFQPTPKGGYARAYGPDLLAHVWAGNVPGLPLWSLVSGLLVKSGSIGKVASAEPLFAGHFARLLVEIEPSLRDSLAVLWWRGGDEASERALFAEADVVLAYGGNEALGQLGERVPITTRYLPHGHKISFQVIAREALDAAKGWGSAHDAARDIVSYDQQGCYSPQCVYVEAGGALSPRDFAGVLAGELAAFESRFPRRALTVGEANAVAGWRHGEERQSLAGADVELVGDSASPWAVAYSGAADGLAPSGLNRTIRVVGVADLGEVVPLVAPHRAYLQSVAVAAAPERLFPLAEALGAEGVTRITALGRMSLLEAGWHHDGRFNLLDLVTITEIEASAERAAERFASYVE